MADKDRNNLTNDDYKDISRMVESGEIFNDARDWYLRTYLLNVVERSWLIVITIALILLLLTAYDYYKSLLPIKTGYPILVNIKDASEEVSRLVNLGNDAKDYNINGIYINLLTREFIEAFESYDWKDDFRVLKSNAQKLKSLGFENIQEDYNERISIRKLNSYLLKYRKNIVRNITVDQQSINFERTAEEKDGNQKYIVSGRFKADEVSATGVASSNWDFKIILYFHEINYNFEKKQFDDLFYKVASYEAKRAD